MPMAAMASSCLVVPSFAAEACTQVPASSYQACYLGVVSSEAQKEAAQTCSASQEFHLKDSLVFASCFAVTASWPIVASSFVAAVASSLVDPSFARAVPASS